MRGKNTILINGRHYDAVSGLPLEQSTAATKLTVTDTSVETEVTVTRTAARSAHTPLHRSQTLRRDIVKKPHGSHDDVAGQRRDHAHVAMSPHISKFAPHPVVTPVLENPRQRDHHSAVVSAAHRRFVDAQNASKPKAMSSRELKDHLIATKLAEAQPNTHHVSPKERTPRRVSSVMAACFAIMLLGGYLSYINMPNLLVRVAAAQAGVDASYPGYTPSGYRFDGPVAYQNGRVTLSFAANGGTHGYTITQQRSSWDSQSVLDNLVAAQAVPYDINASGGLTVYTYGQQAAWVNRGVLFTMSGDAPLRTEQVLKIANSL